MNADTGAVLFEKHPHVPSYPASTTKVATALFVLDHKQPSLEQMVTVSAEAVRIKPVKSQGEYPSYWGEVDGTKMGLLKGEIISFDALLHGLMLVSGNDAANAIAETVSGTVPNFIDELNRYVRSIGCMNTQFQNPHGLHHPEHFSTAYDLCLIAKRALQIPKFREIVSKISYLKPKTNKQPASELRQFNALVKPGKHFYPRAIGVKTGFHSAAMNALVAAAEHDGRTLIAVLLGCPKRNDRYEDAVRLFETAFGEEKETRTFFGPEKRFSREVTGAKTPLHAGLRGDLSISYFPAEEPSCKAFVQWDMLDLPIRKGQKVGEVQIRSEEGTLIQSGPLFAQEEVKGKFLFVLKENISRIRKKLEGSGI
jgi:D-alanyl-D-alanine carboxypeptidase (penicillin-binding protein 5/6)